MGLRNIIPDSKTLNALAPEEVAAAMLQDMNDLRQNDISHRNNQFHPSNYCSGESRAYVQAGQESCEEALLVGWMHLLVTGMLAPATQGNNWCFLTPRARSITARADYEHFQKASLYPRGAIHPTIERETFTEFLRGDYETAVFKAFKAVEVAVRASTGVTHNVIGRDLMVKAFRAEDGALTDKAEVLAEREALMQLFAGAIGRFKNPTSHREVDFDEPAEALEILQLASLLLRIVDRRASALDQPRHSQR